MGNLISTQRQSVLLQAPIKYQRLGKLSNRHWLFSALEVGSLRSGWASIWLSSDKTPLSYSCLLTCAHAFFPYTVLVKRNSRFSGISSSMSTKPTMTALPEPNHLLKAYGVTRLFLGRCSTYHLLTPDRELTTDQSTGPTRIQLCEPRVLLRFLIRNMGEGLLTRADVIHLSMGGSL